MLLTQGPRVSECKQANSEQQQQPSSMLIAAELEETSLLIMRAVFDLLSREREWRMLPSLRSVLFAFGCTRSVGRLALFSNGKN